MARDGIQIQLTGHMEVAAALAALRSQLHQNPLRQAVRKAAQLLLNAIQLQTRVSTGALLGSLRIRVSTSARRGTHATVQSDYRPPGLWQTPLWLLLEKGWYAHGSRRFFRFPFVRNAASPLERQAAQIVIDEVEAQVKKAQAKIDRTAAAAAFGSAAKWVGG